MAKSLSGRSVLRFGPVLVLGLAGLFVGWLLGRGERPAEAVVAKPKRNFLTLNATQTTGDQAKKKLAGLAPVVEESSAPHFVDVAAESGVEFLRERGDTGQFWIVEAMSGGVAWLDYDCDGRPDLYFGQGHLLLEGPSEKYVNVLYRAMPDGTWKQVPRWAGAADRNYCVGVAVGDYDNDGFDDIYLTNYGPDTFYRNNGDGTFSEATLQAGLGCDLWGSSSAFGDLDRDGDLDLYVANFVYYDPTQQCGHPDTGLEYCGPDYFKCQQDALYENNGDGQFADVSAEAGIVVPDGKGLGVVIADLLGDDGWPEVFISNDNLPNFLFHNLTGQERAAEESKGGTSTSPSGSNRTRMRFVETALELGIALNGEGMREANMGIACGDYDNDGDLDIYVTHYYMQHNTLWENQGNIGFMDVTRRVGLSLPSMRQLCWGTHFMDYDNDGWLDLYVAAGHINNKPGTPYEMPNQLMRNKGRVGKLVQFEDISAYAGPHFEKRQVTRGSALADFDRDGDLDVAAVNYHVASEVVRNETTGPYNAIGLRFVGLQSNRNGIGTRVWLTLQDEHGGQRRLMRELHSGGSFASSDLHELLIGIGTAEKVDLLEVRWPSGQRQKFFDLAAGHYWTLREGATHPRSAPFRRSER